MVLQIIIITILIILSAFFSCSETALFSLSRSEVAGFKSSKSKLSKKVIDALSNPRQLLVSILIGNELVNVAIAILVAGLVYSLAGNMHWQMKVLISVAISTPLIVVMGEVIPKNIGIRFARQLSPTCALFIKAFNTFFTPLRRILLKLADSVILLFKGDPSKIRSMIMEEEFRLMVDLGCEEGSIDEAEGELIHRIFELGDKTVEQIMTPKEVIFSLALDATLESAMSQIRDTQFSRMPVYDSNPDDIVGILHIRDLFPFIRRRPVKKVRGLEDIIRPAYFIDQHATLEEVLREFQKIKAHMAVVVDDNRRLMGVVTMDDIFHAMFED